MLWWVCVPESLGHGLILGWGSLVLPFCVVVMTGWGPPFCLCCGGGASNGPPCTVVVISCGVPFFWLVFVVWEVLSLLCVSC